MTAVPLFPNPCPVCGTDDEHAAWRSIVTGSPCTYCPHPGERGHGTGCCCAGRSRPLSGSDVLAPGSYPIPPSPSLAALERRIAALEAAVEPLTRTTRGFLKDCRIDEFRAGFSPPAVRITHLPTGLAAEGGWETAVEELARKLVQRGDITINDGRAAMGLREWEGEWADTAQPLPGAS